MFQKQKLKKPEKDYWYLCMVEKIGSNKKVVQLEYLCPTLDTTGFHSFRVYYQV